MSVLNGLAVLLLTALSKKVKLWVHEVIGEWICKLLSNECWMLKTLNCQ